MKRKKISPKKGKAKKRVMSKKKTSSSKPKNTKSLKYINAIQYMVNVDAEETRLMVASSMGLIPEQ
jgi:hypothetical protein